mmetsp:Transcript_1380/g.3745  ORF Transcript_1380/g.3745 Transcript_1380/m.3745 type:complete len:293 (+) Transcript_1380:2893-3771(+)
MLDLLLHVTQGSLRLLPALHQGLEVRLAVLQLRLRGRDLLALLGVLLFELLQLLRPLLVAGCGLLLDLLVDLHLAVIQCLDVGNQLLQALLHLVQLLVLVLKPVLHLAILVGNAEPLQAFDLVVVGDPKHVVGALPLELLQSRRDFLSKQPVDFINLVLLLLQCANSPSLLVLVHAGARCLLDHAEGLLRLHIDDLGDAALHDQEVGIVHVQRDRVEEVLDLVLLHVVRVEQVSIAATNDNLPCDGDLVVGLVADGTAGLVQVVEDDSDARLRDAGLALLVDELRQVAHPDL